MKISRFHSVVLTLALSVLGVSAARACKYCMSAENADAEYQRQVVAAQSATPSSAPGAFPLDATINQFQAPSAPAALTVAPTADSVVTSGADLRAARTAAAASAPVAIASTALVTPTAVVASVKPANHLADAGLVGLAAVGGVFCWRTRRRPGSER